MIALPLTDLLRPKAPEPLAPAQTESLLAAARFFIDSTTKISRRHIAVVEALQIFGSPYAAQFAAEHLLEQVNANATALNGFIHELQARSLGNLLIHHADTAVARPILGIDYDTRQLAYNAMVGITPQGPALWPVHSGDQLFFEHRFE